MSVNVSRDRVDAWMGSDWSREDTIELIMDVIYGNWTPDTLYSDVASYEIEE